MNIKSNFRKQRGLTLISFGIVLAVGLFAAYTSMKLIPIYLEYHALLNALELVQDDPASADMPAGQIRNRIINSLWVSYASDNIKHQDIKIIRSQGVEIHVQYEVRKTWIGNVDLLAHFDKTVALRR
ncbi:MAG: DUF4845 domain-containing protein [Xanthomonadales bacterium]|nr:DUF4845 domain-containing protein [Xanthomonadales bacterium]